MKYYKRQWDESRGDEYDHWGKSLWYFEIDAEGYPTKQIEEYENGIVLKYDSENVQDDYGGLGDQAIDFKEFAAFEIPWEEFNKRWG